MQVATLRAKYAALVSVLTERSRREWAATEARAIVGYGGIALVARATGIAESTIQRGLRDLEACEPLPAARSRRRGGGGSRRPKPTSPRFGLDALVEPTAPGDPESPLRRTRKIARTLAVALEGLGHHVSHTVVAELLHALGYSPRATSRRASGRQHPDRDTQFRYIAQAVRRWKRRGQPTISVDTKKKELVGDSRMAGGPGGR